MVHEWGGKNGMWVAIGEKLGRPSRYCEARWTLTLSTRESRANIRGGLDKIGATNISADGVIDFRWNDFKVFFICCFLLVVECQGLPLLAVCSHTYAHINTVSHDHVALHLRVIRKDFELIRRTLSLIQYSLDW